MKVLRAAGFTLVELLIVVGILGLLVATFLPDLIGSKENANVLADSRNLGQIHQWLEMGKQQGRLGGLPTEGGHKFLLTLWTKDVVDHSVENFDRFWTPGIREEDAHYKELRQQVDRGEKIWTDLKNVDSTDTDYAARSKQHIKGMTAFDQAWAANDNETGWAFKSSKQVNILWGNGNVRPLSLQEMKEQYQLVNPDTDVFKTYGADSPHPALQKLEN